LVLKKHNYNNL